MLITALQVPKSVICDFGTCLFGRIIVFGRDNVKKYALILD